MTPADETAGDAAVAEQSEAYRLSLDVQIEDVGPCRKHIRVRVPQTDVRHFYDEVVGDLSDKASVPGFRVGHVPQALIQKRFRTEIADDIRQKILMESLEQIADDSNIDPIGEPDLDVAELEIDPDSDFEYDFEVEVRPDFELPSYDGLTIKRPVREISDEDVAAYRTQFLSQYGERVPCAEPASLEDVLTLSVNFSHNGRTLRELEHIGVQLRPVLQFQDADVPNFGELMTGVVPGDVRETEITVSLEAENLEMRGETIQARFTVEEVRQLKLPEINARFLERIGVDSEEDLDSGIRQMLERRVSYQQRQRTREQVLEKITDSADWDLPEKLVLRQVENALRREVLEMQQAGFTTREIHQRENEIRQNAVSTTRQALKEHFVLDRIAETENIEVEENELQIEIIQMAIQSGENPRRVRSRLQKRGMMENLEAQLRERKAVDFILERATFEDEPLDMEIASTTESVSAAVCGVSVESMTATDDSDDDAEAGDSGEE
ncbi:MAG: trigger factor [Planctomycetaceae bacterium]|nr:trigger factor [Planctomycetaceae bacterium]